MKCDSIWKKMVLLTVGTVFALHIQVANSADDSTSVKTQTDEECVITEDDQNRRID